jgi:hypothetical protein
MEYLYCTCHRGPLSSPEEVRSMARARETKGRGRPKGSPTKSATFRLPEDLLGKLAEAASSQDRSQTILVRRAIEAYLAGKGEGQE